MKRSDRRWRKRLRRERRAAPAVLVAAVALAVLVDLAVLVAFAVAAASVVAKCAGSLEVEGSQGCWKASSVLRWHQSTRGRHRHRDSNLIVKTVKGTI